MVCLFQAAIVFSLFSFGTGPASADDWPAFRLDAAHGAWDGAGDIAAAPKLLWAFDTGAVVESSPAVVDGVVYAGSFAQALFAVDAKTGEELW